MKKISILFVICAVILSCQRGNNRLAKVIFTNDSLFNVIKVDLALLEKKPSKISDFTQDIEYIPLETTDSSLVGEIEKMIVWNDSLYIWDRMTESIFCFNSKGKFLFKIHKHGPGPEEYIRISDFDIEKETGNIYIYSDINMSILKYSSKGNFLNKYNTGGALISSFAVQESEKFLFYLGHVWNKQLFAKTTPVHYRFITLQNNDVLYSQLKYKYFDTYTKLSSLRNNFSRYNDTLLLTDNVQPDIYTVTDSGTLMPRYRIDFLGNSYNPSYDKEIDVDKIKSATKNGEYTELTSPILETSKYILIKYSRELIGSFIIRKEDGSVFNLGYVLYDDINQIPINSTFICNDSNDCIYQKLNPDYLIRNLLKDNSKVKQSQKIRDIVSSLDATDNPVIIKIKLK
jgi:hypothetical protein